MPSSRTLCAALLRHEARICTGLAIVLWLVIVVLSLVPGDERPHTGFSGNMEHFVAYAGTAGITALGFRRLPPLWIALPFCIASALFELAQFYIPGRSPGLDNWLASSLGALAGAYGARHLALPLIKSWRASHSQG